MKLRRLVISAAWILALNAGAEAKELRFAGYTPSGHIVEKKAFAPFFETIKANTNGSVSFKYYSAGELLPAKSIMSGLEGGVAHAGQVISLSYTKELPHYHLVNAAMVYVRDALVASGAAQEFLFLHCPECRNDFKQRGLVHLGDYPTTPYFNILCTRDVDSLDDLKGLRIRGLSESARWVAALGATPISMTSPEMIEALRVGHVDCATGPISWIENYSLADSLSSVLVIKRGAYPAINFMTMKQTVWDGLAEAEKQAVIDALPEAIARAAIFGYDAYDAEVRAKTERAGVRFVEVADADLEKVYQGFLESEDRRLRDQFRKAGVREPEAMVASYLRLVTKWEGIVAAMDDRSIENFAEALRKHVFDKVDTARI